MTFSAVASSVGVSVSSGACVGGSVSAAGADACGSAVDARAAWAPAFGCGSLLAKSHQMPATESSASAPKIQASRRSARAGWGGVRCGAGPVIGLVGIGRPVTAVYISSTLAKRSLALTFIACSTAFATSAGILLLALRNDGSGTPAARSTLLGGVLAVSSV